MGKGKKKHQANADETNDAQKGIQKKPETATKQADDTEPRAGKRNRSAIDDIFAKAKPAANPSTDAGSQEKTTTGPKTTSKASKDDDKNEPNKKAKVEGSKDDIFGEEAQLARKRTEEGFRIFTEDELGLNKKGGFTDLCPFDCDCCF